MSSNHLQPQGENASCIGEIRHATLLSDHIGALYLSNNYSDLVLKVESEEFYAHKAILAARSEYFRALLFGGLLESTQNEVVIKDTSAHAFKILLKYIYTGYITLHNLKEDLIIEILGLSHQYGFNDLETATSEFLKQSLTVQNCCLIFDAARLYQLKFLMPISAAFIDTHVTEIIMHDSFLQLSLDSLTWLISRNSFFAPEVDIFFAVHRWIQANNEITSEERSNILGAIRLPLISLRDLLSKVRPTGLISSDTILDAIDTQVVNNDKINHRGILQPDVNMALQKQGTVVLQGDQKNALLDGNSFYDLEKGYTRHSIGASDDPGILIKLGEQSIVNHIKILLWDRDLRSYSYYIEVSIDQKDWTRVVDYTQYYCRSWQYLYFEPRVVKYVRIVGTNNTVNKVFHVVTFEIMFTSKPFTLERGIVVPKHNVATCNLSANVIEGVCRTRNALLDGNTQCYDWESGYTCHQLGSGCIIIQLGQPYLIDSMRLLLWDCDDRSYSYFIEVSVNMWDWELIIDKSNEQCTSWQTLYFEKRPIVFVRITGTQNTANEVFHLVHFECPAQTDESPCKVKSPKSLSRNEYNQVNAENEMNSTEAVRSVKNDAMASIAK